MPEKTNKDQRKDNQDAYVKPDAATLHQTDPQENMEGPVSSLVHNTGEGFDTDESKEEASDDRDKNM